MNVLIIGQGGREHALAWKIAQSPQASHVFVAPGNAGTALAIQMSNVAIDPMAHDELIQFVQEKDIAFTIVGPEAPLAAGIVDAFLAQGLLCLGPDQFAAQLEASKSYSKALMKALDIPTARYASFTYPEEALAYITEHPFPLVIKADGLAAGKGVVIASSYDTAQEAIERFLPQNGSGKIVIEEFLSGEEASFIVLSDGEKVIPFASSQDHKARDNGDNGPNTGGMGAYSPAPIINKDNEQLILARIIQPVIDAMREAGHPYRGFLYAGLMLTDNDIYVLEFNCRFGDPETQVILPRLKSDFLSLCFEAAQGHLTQHSIEWDPRTALGVVLASKGYPEQYPRGDVIHGLERAMPNDIHLFHAGTKKEGTRVITDGGRVLCITALANMASAAQRKAYNAIHHLGWEHCYYRTDIGHRAIQRELTQALC